MPQKTSITVVLGDILQQEDCDGLVNSANSYLIAGGGVCGAIHKAAGPDLVRYTKRLAPLAVGEALASPGFRINAEIIHTVGPKYHQDPDPPVNLARALTSALRLADANGIQRIAVPAISMGIYGYPPALAVPLLVDTAFGLITEFRHLLEVRFVVVDRGLYDLFFEEIGRMGLAARVRTVPR